MPSGVYKKTPEHREKLRQALLGNQNALGCKRPPEYCQKLAQRPYYTSPEWLERMRQLAQSRSPETIEKLRAAGLKRPPPSVATRKKMRQARLHHHPPTKMTSIELSLRHEFKKRRLKFEMHKTVFGRFQPDFVFESVNLIVEADGDYWHRQLKRDHAPLFQAASENGWTVWRFAQSEIVQHPEACGRAVARFVHSH